MLDKTLLKFLFELSAVWVHFKLSMSAEGELERMKKYGLSEMLKISHLRLFLSVSVFFLLGNTSWNQLI